MKICLHIKPERYKQPSKYFSPMRKKTIQQYFGDDFLCFQHTDTREKVRSDKTVH